MITQDAFIFPGDWKNPCHFENKKRLVLGEIMFLYLLGPIQCIAMYPLKRHKKNNTTFCVFMLPNVL